MKRFIIISLLAIGCWQHVSACIWFDNHNSYLFKVCNEESFASRVNKITLQNWKAYMGTSQDYYWFDADEIIKVAQDKGDALMVSYVQQLSKYLECVNEVQAEQWDYPSKEDLNKRKQKLTAIRAYAQGKLKTRLRSQHALLFMRCNMMLGNHAENVTFWEQTASQYIETVYKDMMKNIYAGALLKTGKGDVAGQLFAEMEDWNSLMTQFYKKRSFAAIRQEYLKNPNAKVLPFLLQDFVNNAQEADDATNPNAEGIGGKLFIRDLSKAEVLQMRDFCEQVLKEGKTETPVLWKSAKAWLEYMFGNKQQALADITEATTLAGTQRMQDDARVLRLYINSALAPQSEDFDNWLQGELTWLSQKIKDDYFFHNAQDRIVQQTLKNRYVNNPVKEVGLLNATGSYLYSDYIDTMKVENLEKFYFFTLKTPKTSFERYLKDHLTKQDYVLEDLIGTKYMRLCQWDKAIQWLENIPTSFYEGKGYAVYAANRRYNLGPWIKRQWLKSEELYGDQAIKLSQNPKIQFSREMQKMEGELSVLSGEELKKQYYELAVRYAQASFTGDCWYLMRDGKSVMDTVRVNEVDLAAKAASCLQKAGDPKDFLLKEKVLFARAYVYMNPTPWYDSIWNSETYEYDHIPNPKSAQYKAFATFADFAKKHASELSGYVTRCDEYSEFMKDFAKR